MTAAENAPVRRQAIQSVEAGVEILRALMVNGGSMALRDVAAASGMSRSQTHRYLLAYVNAGLVQQDPTTTRYGLGSLALQLGLAALARTDFVATANRSMVSLVERTGCTGIISVWSDLGPVVIRWYDGLVPIVASIRVGSVVPILRSAAGQCFLAFLPPQVTKASVAREVRRASLSRTEAARSVADIQTSVRSRGYASIADTMLPGLAAVGAPMFDCQGGAVAVLGLVGADGDFPSRHPGFTAALLETAEAASAALGYVAPSESR